MQIYNNEFVFCSLKQSGMHTGNPWPPYKERTPLHPSYRGLVRLLHCKTLHIVIFTLLYKVNKMLWWRWECLLQGIVNLMTVLIKANT